MTNADWILLFRRIPETDHVKVVITLITGVDVYVDAFYRFEDGFAVLRGRFGGSTDEGRGFFVPYNEILCVRIDRVVKEEEIQDYFPEAPTAARKSGSLETPIVPPSERPTPTVPTDPAAASKLLLERIRAVRASSATKFPSHQG
jgi:hypothetical protein